VKNALRKHLLPWLVLWVYRLFFWSWRTTLDEPEELKQALASKSPIIFAHWHGHELAIVQTVRRYRLATMTSLSKDGQLIDFVIVKLGGATSKGSSSRGAVGALKGLVRLVKAGHPASMAVDGPRGPIHEVKPGVFELSRVAKAKIFPVGVEASDPWVFKKSWNKAILPKPFTKIGITFEKAIGPITAADDPKSAALATELERRISDACQQAGKLIDS
jgi:lysophospholipid acyltransferase (LPLAT)-like uncharacterized protein